MTEENVGTMDSKLRSDPALLTKRLWKGALHVLVAATYVGLILVVFAQAHWFTGLITLGIVLVMQTLRYIANAMDRIAFTLSRRSGEEHHANKPPGLHRTSAVVVWLLIQGCNAYVIYVALAGVDRGFGVRVGVALLAIEVVYFAIRFINRRTVYASASFGVSDRSLVRQEPTFQAQRERERQRIDAKLETLREMYEKGEISVEAHSKARDKYLVKHVMNLPDDETNV